jgi:hypothetical protein
LPKKLAGCALSGGSLVFYGAARRRRDARRARHGRRHSPSYVTSLSRRTVRWQVEGLAAQSVEGGGTTIGGRHVRPPFGGVALIKRTALRTVTYEAKQACVSRVCTITTRQSVTVGLQNHRAAFICQRLAPSTTGNGRPDVGVECGRGALPDARAEFSVGCLTVSVPAPALRVRIEPLESLHP